MMKGRIVLQFVLLWLYSGVAKSQNTDRVWVIGSQTPVYMALKFDSLGIDSIFTPPHMYFFATNAGISDSLGNLLFYTNGDYIENRNYQRLQNSTYFNPSTVNDTMYGSNIDGGAIVIPFPDHPNLYYVFHVNYEEFVKNSQYYNCPLELRYSIVDMSLDGGMGGVDPNHKTIPAVTDTLVLGRLMACRHANGRDWWLLAHRFQNNSFYKLLITPDSIYTYTQDIGNNVLPNTAVGFTLFNLEGSKMAIMEYDTLVDLYDFNRCTGQLSNYFALYIHNALSPPTGIAFSAGERFIYVSTLYNVYQYDLFASDITASRITVATLDSVTYNGGRLEFSDMKLAPDGKIYINTWAGTQYIHVINEPDSFGLACNLIQHAIHLSQWNILTFPVAPNYSLGPIVGSTCDTLTNKISDVNLKNTYNVQVYPNPAHDKFSIHTTFTGEIEMKLVDQTSKTIFSRKVKSDQEINVSFVSSGIYFLELNLNGERVNQKIVVEH